MVNKKKKSLPSSLIVTQSNQLIEARYSLPLGEQRLILTMLSRIQPGDEDFKEYRISITEFAEFMGINKNHVYAECKKTTKQLLTRVLEIQEPGMLLQTNWVSSAKYIDGEGCVRLCFDPLLKPYLLQLKSNFTSCRLEMLLSFKSQYTYRIYSLLKQYQNLKEREIELDLLRGILGIGKEQYHEYKNFKSRILQPTCSELAEKADIYFEFDEIKAGRKVSAIKFNIITKKPTKTIPDTQDKPDQELILLPPPSNEISISLDQLLALVPEQHRTRKTILSALEAFEKKHGFDYVKRNILYSNIKADNSYAGFLNKSLKNDWGHDWELDQKIIPDKKKVKEIWEKEGFGSESEYAQHMFDKQMDTYRKQIEAKGKSV